MSAALPPWEVRPALITMMGLVKATSRAAERKLRASPDRLHVDEGWLWFSDPDPGNRIMSPQPTSSIDPMEMKAENPTIAGSSIEHAVHIAPDWEMKPTFPGEPSPVRMLR
jgi:hypothetical protein